MSTTHSVVFVGGGERTVQICSVVAIKDNLMFGRPEMEMSFTSMNGMPARTSTSRSSTTRPSNRKSCPSRVNVSVVTPTTDNGDAPSA